jgi:hypothetical protein
MKRKRKETKKKQKRKEKEKKRKRKRKRKRKEKNRTLRCVGRALVRHVVHPLALDLVDGLARLIVHLGQAGVEAVSPLTPGLEVDHKPLEKRVK